MPSKPPYRNPGRRRRAGGLPAFALWWALAWSSGLPAPAMAQQAPAARDAPAHGNFVDLMDRASRAASGKDWDSAERLTGQAYDAAPNDYYRVEAVDLRTRIEIAADRLPAARKSLQTAIALLADGRSEDLAEAQAWAARLAFRDHDPAQGQALANATLKSSQAYPGDWLVQDGGSTLFYRLAGVKLPVMAGDFVRNTLHAADRRDDVSRVRFVPLEQTHDDVGVTVEMDYQSLARQDPVPSLDSELRMRIDAMTTSSARMKTARTADPGALAFHPQGATGTAARLFLYTDDAGHAMRKGLWLASRDMWIVSVEADWPAQQDAAVRERLQAFLAAVDWSAPPVAPAAAGKDVQALLEQANNQRLARQWPQARALADQAGRLAVFPDEHAAALSLLGVTAFHSTGHDDKARRYLEQAQAYWPWVGLSGYQEELFDAVQLCMAELYYRANDTAPAIAAMDRYTRGTTYEGQLDEATGVLKDRATGLGLPPRLAGFLRTLDDSRIYYLKPGTPLRVGVTLLKNSPAPDMDSAVAQLAQWMKQTRKASFQAHDMVRQSFDPAIGTDTGTGTGAHGMYLRIPFVQPDGDAPAMATLNPDNAPPAGQRVMGLWIVQPAGEKHIGEIILRAEWAQADTAAESAFAQLARSFPWP